MKVDIIDFDVFNEMSGDTADDGWMLGNCAIAGDVAHDDTLQRANRNTLRSAHPHAQAQKERRVANVTHCDPHKSDVLEARAINRSKGKAATAFEDTVGNSNVLEAAV